MSFSCVLEGAAGSWQPGVPSVRDLGALLKIRQPGRSRLFPQAAGCSQAGLRWAWPPLKSIEMKRVLLALLAFTFAVSVQAQDAASFKVGAFTFERPADWENVPVKSPMRKAQLKVPGKDAAAAAELTFFHFGSGQGGDVQANAQRWLAQFKSDEGASKVDTKEIAGTKVTIVTTKGTFNSGMPGGPTTPMEGYKLLGAILESEEGAVFAKMTGPDATVTAAEPKFMEFITKAAGSAKK